jgi:hypothetical protein
VAGATEYCRQVIAMGGLDRILALCTTAGEAQQRVRQSVRSAQQLAGWDALEIRRVAQGEFRFMPGGGGPGAAEVLGDVRHVLHATVGPQDISSRRFTGTEYSIGLGALGDRFDDYYLLLGEMMTIGGTMVWLPTDGNDTPDYLIPQRDTGGVTIRTGFNVALAGGFDELAMFRSAQPGGTPVGELYRALFALARERRRDFRGALGLAARAELGAVYGSGVKKAPVAANTPADGKMIIAAEHSAEWFDFDAQPRYTGVTGLICGIGVDLTADLSQYDARQFDAVFYRNPANTAGQDQLLHNHATLFAPLPMPERAADLEREVRRVVADGEFTDMRHLLDNSTVTSALLGLSYVQEFRRDPAGNPHAAV